MTSIVTQLKATEHIYNDIIINQLADLPSLGSIQWLVSSLQVLELKHSNSKLPNNPNSDGASSWESRQLATLTWSGKPHKVQATQN